LVAPFFVLLAAAFDFFAERSGVAGGLESCVGSFFVEPVVAPVLDLRLLVAIAIE
jgi:hypothetical protein